jgi:hypothetical protein
MVNKMEFDADLKILNNAILSFLSEDATRKKLKHILKRPNKDWEKWLQIELEYHLEMKCKCDAKREVPAIPDHRYRTGKLGMYIDLLIRKKLFEEEHYIYVELKCESKTAYNLYNKMLVDSKKLESIKQSFLDKSVTKMRSYWCIGFFKETDSEDTQYIIEQLAEQHFYSTTCKTVSICTCIPRSKKCDCGRIGYIIF